MTLVLVVDDTSIIREPIAAALTAAGYQTVCAGDGREAVAALDRQTPDVVVLDLLMPEMSGLQVLEAMRRRPATANTPVILLTATADRETVLSAAQWGVRDYVLKSGFSLTHLLSRVQKYAQPGQTTQAAGADRARGGAPFAGAGRGPRKRGGTSSGRLGRDKRVLSADRRSIVGAWNCRQGPSGPGLPAAPAAVDSRAVPRPRRRGPAGQVALRRGGAQVIAEAAARRGSVNELSGLIARDPLLSARVLQTANSTAYAAGRPTVGNIPDAVRQIGCTAVRNIASALGLFDAMPTGGADGFSPVRVLAALVRGRDALPAPGRRGRRRRHRVPGRPLPRPRRDPLPHAFRRRVPPGARRRGRGAGRRDELERRLMGITHGELARTILRRMGLPDVIRDPIERFHDPSRAAGGAAGGFGRDAAGRLARVLRAADSYANGLLLCATGMANVAPLTRAECKTMTGVEDPPRPDVAEFRSQVLALTGLLARLTPGRHGRDDPAPLRADGHARLAGPRRDAVGVRPARPGALVHGRDPHPEPPAQRPGGMGRLPEADRDRPDPDDAQPDRRRHPPVDRIRRRPPPRPLAGRPRHHRCPAPSARPGDPTPEPWPISLDRLYHFIRATELPTAAAA